MRILSWMTALLALMPGCTAADVTEDSDDIMEAEVALVGGNQLAANALALNALALNGIALNGIALNAMDPDSLAAIQDPGNRGTLARSFLRYAISCAFSSSQSFSFTWTDGASVVHEETYHGDLGAAPGWATGPLDLYGQRLVSACIVARVNYYQVPVLISLRCAQDPLRVLSGSPELVDYPNVEGAFWGNLWGSAPAIYACYNSATVTNSRSWSRDCAAGHLRDDGTVEECGMIDVVGPCNTVCASLNGGGQYYPFCEDNPYAKGKATTKLVVTTSLP